MSIRNMDIERKIHYMMSVVGGFLGAYALLNRMETFGSSQTSNMIYFIMNLLGRNTDQKIARFFAVIIYMLGFVVTVIIPRFTKINLHIFSIVCDIIAVIIIGFLPVQMDPVIALYPIFFAMAIQWNSFKSADGFVSATIFSTNNLRQTTTSLTEYILDHDKEKLRKFKFYIGVLCSFHIGVTMSYLGCKAFSVRGAFFCLIPLIFSLFLVRDENKMLQLLLSRRPLRAFNKDNYVMEYNEEKAS